MHLKSALLNVMTAAAQKAARGLVRDFGEVENLQVSRKGPGDFVSAADRKAEEVLLADDARRLRRMYDVENSGISPEAVDEYVALLSAPGALTAALNWYRAMSSDNRVDRVEVPTTYVWSDADVAIGRTAAEACACRAMPILASGVHVSACGS